MTRFRFIGSEEAAQPTWTIATMCRLLGVSRSGYYAWRSRPPSVRSVADPVLTEQIREVHADPRGLYGRPRVHAELADRGVHVGGKRVARLMRVAGLVGCHRRKFRGLTQQDPQSAPAPDLVDREFAASAPNQLWCSNVTYVPTLAGWLYLAVVIDVFSRLWWAGR